MHATGHISELIPNEGFYAFVPFPQTYLIDRWQVNDVEVRVDDGRTISNQQRRSIYMLLRDIADKTGYLPEEAKEVMKYEFIARTGHDYFSLSDCSVTTGRLFLDMLVDFCLEWDVPTKIPIIEWVTDINWWVYRCLVHKKCCITQKKAQLHHVDAVGMGRDRRDIIHRGMRVMPLFWRKHRECHDMGQKSFNEKYHIVGVKLDSYLCGIWGVKD